MITIAPSLVQGLVSCRRCGYALSRTNAWWKRPFLYAIVLVRVVPPPALIVPLYRILLTGNDAVGSFVRSFLNPDWVRPVMQVSLSKICQQQ